MLYGYLMISMHDRTTSSFLKNGILSEGPQSGYCTHFHFMIVLAILAQNLAE